MWLNTTSHHVKRVYTDNERECVMLELQFFLKEQEIIHKTSISHIHQQNGCAEQLNCILLENAQSIWLEAYLPDSW